MPPAYNGRQMAQLTEPATADHPSKAPQLNARPAENKAQWGLVSTMTQKRECSTEDALRPIRDSFHKWIYGDH